MQRSILGIIFLSFLIQGLPRSQAEVVQYMMPGLPQRQINNALSAIEEADGIGQELLNQLKPSWDPTDPKGKIEFFDFQNNELAQFDPSSTLLFVYNQFLAASHYYVSWIFVYGFTKTWISYQTGHQLPDYLESEQLAFMWASRHWSQIQWQKEKDHSPQYFDYAKDQQFGEEARRLDVSSTKWNALWCRPDLNDFLDQVKIRQDRWRQLPSIYEESEDSPQLRQMKKIWEQARQKEESQARPCL